MATGCGEAALVRVAIISESFLPQVNGVTNSVLRVCEQLTRHGHEALVIAPGPGPAEWSGVPVVRTPSCPVPGYRDFRVALPFPAMTATLHEFDPDVVHLASPAVLGAQGATAAAELGIPCVAVHEKDLGLLTAVQELPGVRLVMVGDGPQRRQLERQLDRALFTGVLTGDRLAG